MSQPGRAAERGRSPWPRPRSLGGARKNSRDVAHKRKGHSPSVASIYRALAEQAKREAYPEALEQAYIDFAVASGEQGRHRCRRNPHWPQRPSPGSASTHTPATLFYSRLADFEALNENLFHQESRRAAPLARELSSRCMRSPA